MGSSNRRGVCDLGVSGDPLLPCLMSGGPYRQCFLSQGQAVLWDLVQDRKWDQTREEVSRLNVFRPEGPVVKSGRGSALRTRPCPPAWVRVWWGCAWGVPSVGCGDQRAAWGPLREVEGHVCAMSSERTHVGGCLGLCRRVPNTFRGEI